MEGECLRFQIFGGLLHGDTWQKTHPRPTAWRTSAWRTSLQKQTDGGRERVCEKERLTVRSEGGTLTMVHVHGAGLLSGFHIHTALIGLPRAGKDGSGPLDQPAHRAEVVHFHVVEISAKSWKTEAVSRLAATFIRVDLQTQTNATIISPLSFPLLESQALMYSCMMGVSCTSRSIPYLVWTTMKNVDGMKTVTSSAGGEGTFQT